MRVLHLGKYYAPYAGGIENFLVDLVKGTSAMGVANAVLVHQSAGVGSGVDGSLADDHAELLFRSRSFGQLAYAPVSPGFPLALARMIKRFEPDLLHLHLPNTSAFWALFSPAARRIPWVVHWHSDVVGPGLDKHLALLYPFYRPFEQAVLRRASKIVATSPNYLESSPALAGHRQRCETVSLGLDPARLASASPTNSGPWRNPGHLRLLCVGRLARYKGLAHLVDAVAATDKVELVIVGQGPLQSALARKVQASGAEDRIRLAGSVEDETRNQWLSTCDLLVLPSVNRAEAFGLCLLEAMACGKPVLATSVPGAGMSWVVEHGQTGWLVEPGDSKAMSARLADLQVNRPKMKAAGKLATERFGQRFHIHSVAECIVELYGQILGNR